MHGAYLKFRAAEEVAAQEKTDKQYSIVTGGSRGIGKEIAI